ncbi:MAG: hypothetical protein AAGB48_03020 [Planctomycetota bacterium]
MLKPAPTSAIDPKLARGILEEVSEPTATKPAFVVLSFPNTSYRTHLEPVGEIRAEVGKRIVGTIRAEAKRIDVVTTGGRYVEPVYGRPRRVQGTVIAVHEGAVVVHAGMPIHCTPTDPRQSAEDFEPGQFVSFDVMRGATFEEDRRD